MIGMHLICPLEAESGVLGGPPSLAYRIWHLLAEQREALPLDSISTALGPENGCGSTTHVLTSSKYFVETGASATVYAHYVHVDAAALLRRPVAAECTARTAAWLQQSFVSPTELCVSHGFDMSLPFRMQRRVRGTWPSGSRCAGALLGAASSPRTLRGC